MKHLPDITLVSITTKDYGQTIVALQKSLEQIEPKETLYFSDVPYSEDPRIQHIPIERFKSVEDYNRFVFKELGAYIETSHVLVIQWDGYVISGESWSDEFLKYDYIGAPWTYTDGRNVGNGGFSLRSRHLHRMLQKDEFEYYSPEDEKICRYYRQTLEKKFDIKFAPEEVAHRFSFELHRPTCRTFGFHNFFHQPYREPVILKRTGAMGDLIMLEPVMQWFWDHGYRVILDTQAHYWNLFAKHFFPVELLENTYGREDLSGARIINLDMSYETEPKQLALLTYYKYCGITDGEPRNPRLNFRPTPEVRLFDKYVVLHTDDTAMAHRNVRGVDWDIVADFIRSRGYLVFRVGIGNGKGGDKINTYSENMLAYIISGAQYFIGIDSGCAQIAVATEVKAMIFFGSVNPQYRYDRFEHIKVMQHDCPLAKDGCYHEVISVVGQDCEANKELPPCIHWKTTDVVEHVKSFIS